jgi:hypothetical protein
MSDNPDEKPEPRPGGVPPQMRETPRSRRASFFLSRNKSDPSLDSDVATRADLVQMERVVLALGADLKDHIARIKAKIDLMEYRLLTRLGGLLGGLIVVLAGLLFAALRYWPPRHG